MTTVLAIDTPHASRTGGCSRARSPPCGRRRRACHERGERRCERDEPDDRMPTAAATIAAQRLHLEEALGPVCLKSSACVELLTSRRARPRRCAPRRAPRAPRIPFRVASGSLYVFNRASGAPDASAPARDRASTWEGARRDGTELASACFACCRRAPCVPAFSLSRKRHALAFTVLATITVGRSPFRARANASRSPRDRASDHDRVAAERFTRAV